MAVGQLITVEPVFELMVKPMVELRFKLVLQVVAKATRRLVSMVLALI